MFFIFGSSGFIGSKLKERLIENNILPEKTKIYKKYKRIKKKRG